MSSSPKLDDTARRLAKQLQETGQRIVFAESCTGGLVSATLTQIPGISEFHCGSAVVYRIKTKAEWLGVSRDKLADPGPVSAIVAEQMALGVLHKTPEADIGVSVTGHLGPNAPENQDGLIFIGVATRASDTINESLCSTHFRLGNEIDGNSMSVRNFRQFEAAQHVLEVALSTLSS